MRRRHAAFLFACVVSAALALGLLLYAAATGLASPVLAMVAVLQVVTITLAISAHRAVTRRMGVLEMLTESDPATGCLNRRGFARALEEVSSMGGDAALLAIDLDHFKQVNDTYGHNVGDAILASVAATLCDVTGHHGVVARLGGEEFAVLLTGADAEQAGVLAEHMLSRVREDRLPHVAPGARVTMSVGIAAERVASERDGAALRARADEALYVAKRGGRDRVLLWAPGVRSNATPAAAAVPIIRSARWHTQADMR